MSILGQAAILLTYMQLSLHYSKEYSLEDDLKVTNEEEFKPTFRGSMMFLYELASMFCISIFNHEVGSGLMQGEPFMQGLTSKGNHFKFIMLPLVLILLITLDISDMVNEILQINLETKPEYANVRLANPGQLVLLHPVDFHGGLALRLDAHDQVYALQRHFRLAVIIHTNKKADTDQ